MTSSPVQIRELLLKSIDKDAKVVDAGGVTKAISALEKMTLTKEALEETRLGKLVNNIRKATTDDRLKERCRRLIQMWKNQFVISNKSKQADGQSPTTSQLNQKSASKSARKASSLVSQTPVTTGGTPVDQTKSENRKRRKHHITTSSPEDNVPPKKQQIVHSPKQATKEIWDKDRVKQPEEGASPDQRERSLAKGKSSEGNKDAKSLHKQVVLSNANKAAGVVDKTESQTRAKRTAKPTKSKKSPKGAAKHGTSSGGNSGRNGSASSPRQSIQYKEINQASRPLLTNRAIIPTSPESYHNNEDAQGSNSEREAVPSLFDEEDAEDEAEGEKEEVQEGSLDELTMSSVPDSPVDSQESSSSQHSYESNKFSEFGDDVRKADKQTAGDESLPKREVKEEVVDRLHNEHWEGMNGNFSSDGRWSSWDSCLVLDSGEGHSLHILPYVCID